MALGAALHASVVGARWRDALALLPPGASAPALGSALAALGKASRWRRAVGMLPPQAVGVVRLLDRWISTRWWAVRAVLLVFGSVWSPDLHDDELLRGRCGELQHGAEGVCIGRGLESGAASLGGPLEAFRP